jgi:hypothetical protein
VIFMEATFETLPTNLHRWTYHTLVLFFRVFEGYQPQTAPACKLMHGDAVRNGGFAVHAVLDLLVTVLLGHQAQLVQAVVWKLRAA